MTLPSPRTVELSVEVTRAAGPVVSHTIHYRFDDGEVLASSATLRFRTMDELRTSLAAAGFTVERVFGGWAREAVGRGDGELLVVPAHQE